MKHKKVLGLILSLVLVLCVAIPGTLASENLNQPVLVCEKTEHTHDANCWTVPETPACGMEEGAGAHTHDGSCYGYLEGLICTLPEDENHTHGAECYGVVKTLACTLPVDENHAHTDSCYAPQTVLTCSLAESAGHIHGADCYPAVLSCTLEEHTHDAACYAAPLSEEENEPTCTCGSVDGTHIAGCPLYVAPQEPVCTCIANEDGTLTYTEGCPVHEAPQEPVCTCIANEDGTLTYTEGCPVHEAPTAESEHIEGCSDECTNEECTCLCHLFDRLMACQTLEELLYRASLLTEEEINSLTVDQLMELEYRVVEFVPELLNPITVSDEEETVDEPVPSEMIHITKNVTNVAPFSPQAGG